MGMFYNDERSAKDGTDDDTASGGPTGRADRKVRKAKGKQGSFCVRLVTQIVKYSLGPAL